MANLIANGVFKKLIYAKEFELGKLQDVAGEGLKSPATASVAVGITSGQTTGVGTAANQVSFTGLLVEGQTILIGSDTYRLTGVSNSGGNGTASTITSVTTGLTQWVNSHTAGAKVTVLASTEEFKVTTGTTGAVAPNLNTTATVTTGTINTTTVVINTSAVVIPLGQKFTITTGDTSTTVYEVVGSTGGTTNSSGATLTVYPALKAAATGGITFKTGTSAQFLRRVTSNLDLKLQTFKSNEIRSDMQRSSQSVGSRSVDGTISGELSNRTYSEFMESVLRRKFTNQADVAIAASGFSGAKDSPRITISFASDPTVLTKLKVGDVVYFTTSSAMGYENRNMIVTGVTATQVTLDLLIGELTADLVTSAITFTIKLRGKKTFFPKTGHTIDSYAIEHFYEDIGESELFKGCRATQMSLKMSPSAMATIDVMFMGTGMTTKQSQQLAGAKDAGTDNVVAATNGAVYLKVKKGNTAVLERIGLLTSLDVTINLNGSNAQVIGSDTTPDVFLGAVDIQGNTALYFQSGQYRDMFLNQEEASLVAVFRSDGNVDGEFISIVLPKIQASGASRDDGEKGLIMTMPFTALLYDTASGVTNFENTSIQIQDSSL
jgi:hypothetical protein